MFILLLLSSLDPLECDVVNIENIFLVLSLTFKLDLEFVPESVFPLVAISSMSCFLSSSLIPLQLRIDSTSL